MTTNENLIDDTNEESFQWESLPEFYHEYMVDLYSWLDHQGLTDTIYIN